MRRVFRRRLQRRDHHALDLVGGDRGRWARTGLAAEAVEALLDEPGTPLAHVAAAQPSSAASVLLSAPPAQASTIRERNANACDDFALRDQRVSGSRVAS